MMPHFHEDIQVRKACSPQGSRIEQPPVCHIKLKSSTEALECISSTYPLPS